ncbi:MAG: ABC transporter permease [Nannocystales bacterium]
MNLLSAVVLIVRRSLRQHAVSTAITVVATALAAGLVLSVFSIQAQAFAAFTGGPVGFDAAVGARGSQLQLVLNSVFHLETSQGNVPWSLYEELARDPRVKLAIPYSTGDSYEGFRVVGTTEALFVEFEYRDGERFEVEDGGRTFDPERAEAVLGSYVAQRTGLTVGSTFSPSHGVGEHSEVSHDEAFVVTGVLQPTNTPSDRVIWIPIEGIFRMGGHVLRGGGEEFEAHPHQAIPDQHKEVSAVMLKFRSPMAGFALDRAINRDGKDATLAFPIGRVMADLFETFGWANRVLEFVAYLVVLVSSGAIFASLYNTINARRREIAILRSLGASRPFLFTAIVVESSTIAFVGALLGFAVYAALLVIAAAVIREQTGVVLRVWTFHPAHVWTPICMACLGALAGLAPAAKAYSTDVASHLKPQS